MKKTYKTMQAFIILLSLITLKVGAQALSGTITISSASVTGGNNYQSFTAFATAVNSVGISGPLVVDVIAATGPYNEQPAFTNIAGTSPANTITINGNGNMLTFNATSSAAPYTMLLNGTKYLAVNNLVLQGQGATYAQVCQLTNQADYNTFTSCQFSAAVNGSSSYQIPFCFSAGTGLQATGGNFGNFNTIKTCTLTGGYYSITHYGLTSAPYSRGNTFDGCTIQDWYYNCIYGYYAKDFTVKNCDFSRPNRTTHTSTTYFIFGNYWQNALFDSNVMHDFWGGNTSFSGTMYGMYYIGANAIDLTLRNKITNNIFRDMKWAGTIYMFYYNQACSNDYIHNTFSFDYAANTSSYYGFYYCYGSANNYSTYQNNLFSITKGGTNYAFYQGGNVLGANVYNYNNYYTTGTSNYVGYWTAAALTLANWQTACAQEANSSTVNPNFVSLATGDLHPSNLAMDNTGNSLGVVFDEVGAVRNQSTPDIGALEFNIPLCSGTPGANSVAGANYILCPGQGAGLSIGNLNNIATSGLTYQWQTSSVSGVGPWTTINGATGLYYNAPSTYSTTYYSVVISCTNPGGGSTAPVTTLNIASTTTSLAPYYESFENIGLNNRLPNCSWYSANLGAAAKSNTSALSANRVARTGSAFAYFDLTAGAGTNHYYTNGINLVAGITYSISTWFQTDFTGATNWTDFSLLLGTAQNTTGLVSLASTNGPAVSAIYKPLSNTFSVSTSGLYYVAVRATANSGTAQYLTWDDLSIIIPCTANLNTPNLTVGANQSTICSGSQAILSGAGANSYAWSTGSTSSSITVSPNAQTTYTCVGTNALTGCTSLVTKTIFVNSAPSIALFANPPVVCSGAPTNLMTSVIGGGQVNFAWNNLMTGPNIVVSPTITTSYTVIATGQNGCNSSSAITISINPLPVLNIAVSNANICVGDNLVLTATGAANCTWLSSTSNVVLVGTTVNTSINATGATVYSVTGTDSKGCQNVATTNISVNACTGISELSKNNAVSIYPNPSAGIFTVEFVDAKHNTVEVLDVTGRLMTTNNSETEKVEVNISNFAAGVYYVKASNGNTTNTFKIVKQ